MAKNPNLPEELLIEIFSRLPAKSVGRFRCLSRSWRSQLSEPQFLNLHLNHKPHQETLLLITIDEYRCFYGNFPSYCRSFSSVSDRFINTVTLPITEEEPVLNKIDVSTFWVEVVGSVHGLVLMLNEFDSMLLLMNPVTREHVMISIPVTSGHNMYGFGYDGSSNDYKIVMLADGKSYSGVSVYSVKTGLWVRKDDFPSYFRRASGALLDGALHWFTDDSNSQVGGSPLIVAFDLASEEFRPVHVPTHTDRDGFYSYTKIYVLGGCLCVVDIDNWFVDAWMMKNYGIRESWNHLVSCPNELGTYRLKPLYYGGGELLLVDSSMMDLIVYNVEEKTKKEVWLGDRDVVTDGCVFVESLVSPKHLAVSSME